MMELYSYDQSSNIREQMNVIHKQSVFLLLFLHGLLFFLYCRGFYLFNLAFPETSMTNYHFNIYCSFCSCFCVEFLVPCYYDDSVFPHSYYMVAFVGRCLIHGNTSCNSYVSLISQFHGLLLINEYPVMFEEFWLQCSGSNYFFVWVLYALVSSACHYWSRASLIYFHIWLDNHMFVVANHRY